jgi:uncharacterized protein YggE
MASKAPITGTLSAVGEGRVQVKPDVARIQLSIVTEARAAEDAVRENAAQAEQVIERLRALGLRGRSLETLGISVYPQLSFDAGTERGRIIGYRAENTIAVVAPVELAGKVIDEGVGAGANQISSLTFGLRDETAARNKALKAAVNAAQVDAEAVAEATAVRLSTPSSIEILSEGRPVILRELARETAGATPILPGEVGVTARVRVVFAYRAG